jgi:hypothetical protein
MKTTWMITVMTRMKNPEGIGINSFKECNSKMKKGRRTKNTRNPKMTSPHRSSLKRTKRKRSGTKSKACLTTKMTESRSTRILIRNLVRWTISRRDRRYCRMLSC